MNAIAAMPNVLAAPKLQVKKIYLSLVLTDSGREIYVPPITLSYLGRRDSALNIYPHVDFTCDNAAARGVSRRHARIYQSDEGIYIEDAGSTNGTFVNGQRLQLSQIFPLCHGDIVQLGLLKFKIVFSYG